MEEAARVPYPKRKEIRAQEARHSKPSPMTAGKVISLAEKLGWTLETGGEHIKLVKGDRKVPVPVHGGSGQNLGTGTLRAILKIIEAEE